jgi:acyl-CoA synthetase (AMP-forming)/AMP-acid ligase II
MTACSPLGGLPDIAVLQPNSHYVLEFFFAAVTDSVLFPLNHRLSPVEIEAGRRTSGAVVLLTSDAFAETLAEIDWATLPVQIVVRTGAAVELEVTDHRSWDSRLSAATSPYPCEPSRPVPSSYLQGVRHIGSTGRSKTVLHSHRNVLVHSVMTFEALELNADDDHCWGHGLVSDQAVPFFRTLPFVTRCPGSASGNARPDDCPGIRNVPVLAPSADRDAMSDLRVLERASRPPQGHHRGAVRGDPSARDRERGTVGQGEA